MVPFLRLNNVPEGPIEDRCGGVFDDIETVIPRAELAAHAEHYKQLSGFSIDTLNAQPPILGPMEPVSA